MLLYALEKGPTEKNDNYKTAEPWEISAERRDLATWWKRDTRSTYTAIPRKVVGKTVHATIRKGNMGYDQYTVPDTVAVEPTFIAFL